MWINIPIFILGLVLLVKGADWITDYGSRLAKRLGVSELVIGLTLVALATSLPELAVSVISALGGVSQIATGTIIGSNISNIALILGASALVYPMATGRSFFKQGFFTLGFSLLVAALLLGGMFWYEGLVIIALFIAYIIYDIRNGEEGRETSPGRTRWKGSTKKCLAACILGGLIVVAGAQLLITSTVSIARWLAVPEILIAMIIIAIGTSLPELATSVTAAAKRMRGISLGNIIGSNIFNIAILGIASLASAVPVTPHVVMIDLPFMLLVTVLFIIFIRTGLRLSRKEGAVLLAAYMVFVALQFAA